MARNVTIQIRAETGAAEENLQSFEGELEEVEGAAQQAGTETDRATDRMGEGAQEAAADVGRSSERIEEDMMEVSQSADRAASSTSQVGSASSSASALLFDLSDAAQDMSHNLGAGANNAGFLFEQFGRVKQEAGGLFPALKSIGGALAGPAGIAFAVTTVMQHSDDLIGFFTESGEAAEKARERYQEAADSLLSITSPVEDQEIELGLEAARQTATELENELQRVNETISNLQDEGMQEAVRGGVPTSEQTERRLEALKKRRSELEGGLQTIQERVGQIEAELALQEELEKVTGETAENREKGTKTTEERAQAFDGLAVSAQEAAKNMETVDRFFEDRERQQSLFQPIEMPEVPSFGEAMLQDIGPVQERLDVVQQILDSAGDKAAQIDMSTLLSDSAKTERKLSLAQSKLQKMSGQGIPLTEARFSAVAETIGLSAEEAETLRKRILGTADAGEQAQIRLSEVQKEVRKTQQQLVKGQASPQKLIDQLDKAGRRLQQFSLGTQLDATRMKIQQVTATLRRMRQQGVDPTAQRVQNLKNKLRNLQREAELTRIGQQAGLQAAQAGFRNLGKVIAGAKSEMEALKDVTSTVLQSLGSALLQGAIAGPLGAPFAIAGGAMLAGGSAIQSFESGGETETPVQLVGEEGPELVSLPSGSRVADHESSTEIIRMIERASEGRAPGEGQSTIIPSVSATVTQMGRQGLVQPDPTVDSETERLTARTNRLAQVALSGPDGGIESGSTTSNGEFVLASRPDTLTFSS